MTSDERREVAEELRNYMRLRSSDTFEAFYTRLNGVLFGDDGFDRPDGDVFERLADLIYPKCYVVPSDEESTRLPHCSRCGHPILRPWPDYCPQCGSRVTRGGEC